MTPAFMFYVTVWTAILALLAFCTINAVMAWTTRRR